MHSVQIKNRVKELRKQGMGIYDIARTLSLRTSTVSGWCKNIQLTKEMKRRISENGKKKARAGMLAYTEKLRLERMERVKSQREHGVKSLGKLTDRDFHMIGLGLYWGEGYKDSHSELGFTNSDVLMVKFYLRWLGLLGVGKESLIFRLSINNIFREQEERMIDHWVGSLGVDKDQFTKTSFIKTNLKKADPDKSKNYFGTLRVKVRRGGELKNKILGSLEHISSCI